jgi:hypothetical protein
MRRLWPILFLVAASLPLSATAQRQVPPHAFLFGAWTGGLFPAVDASGPACLAQPSVIFTADVVMRASLTDVAYRQRLVETVSVQGNRFEFRLLPAAPVLGALGARVPPDAGFGCPGGANVLRVERRGEDQIVFPDCAEFVSPLLRCASR